METFEAFGLRAELHGHVEDVSDRDMFFGMTTLLTASPCC